MRVSEQQIARSAQITPILDKTLEKSRANQNLVEAVTGMLRFSNDPQAVALIEYYDEMPKKARNYVPIEALCIAAQVSPTSILGLTIMCARQLSAHESALRTVINHPEVTQATIDYAIKLPGASKDREMVHQAVGWLPSSKGSLVSVNLFGNNQQSEQQGEPAGEEEDDNESFGRAFPTLNSYVEKWGDDRRKLLDKGK